MRVEFVTSVLKKLLGNGTMTREDSILAVCAGAPERDLFTSLGFGNVTVSNLDESMAADQLAPLKWSFQDAQNLSFEDEQFDFAFVSDGLHHCPSPHRAMLEMYRVAKKGVIVFEARDSMLMKLAGRLGFCPDYEVVAVADHGGTSAGVSNSHIPNFVYRWTEAEFKKTLSSFNPTGKHAFRFFHALHLPYHRAAMRRNQAMLWAVRIAGPLLKLLSLVCRKQGNSFGMVAIKPSIPGDLWPWLIQGDSGTQFNPDYVRKTYRQPGAGTSERTTFGLDESRPSE